METINKTQVIAVTKKWIKEVVIGCNFCPFAGKVIKEETIRFVVSTDGEIATILENLIAECLLLNQENTFETTLIVLPVGFENFENYLDLIDLSEQLIEQQNLNDTFQIASFHPDYIFADSNHEDPSNYTNRSIYPMIHILKTESVATAINLHPDTKSIPDDNIAFSKSKGLAAMKALRASCLK